MIEIEQVRHVAHLARLELTPAEEEQLTRQLGDILSYVEQLQELDTEGIEPTFHALDVPSLTRPDQVQPWPDTESILAGAPERADQFFKVPRILGGEED
ncbi:MAG: Asp-tRNA(Asn)/Glu-tRNA(Gln) amidotransferase subunit GatC [Cyanophyceae cyanobacterium]|jgi:aspartyl-tRNA(Asn)/glutamyl-tRNA(Gln) amidotransferase subunit C